MRIPFAMTAVALLTAALVSHAEDGGIVVDADRHRVTFTATSTDCGVDTQLEFLFVGPGSDRDYEAMFVTDDSLTDLAAAFEKAGVPLGRNYDVHACHFWPIGSPLTLEPSLSTLVVDKQQPNEPAPVVFTGGTRNAEGVPEAATNAPCAFFALYNCGQSLLQIDDSLDQSVVYGRFQPAVKIPKGEKRRFTLTWNGQRPCDRLTLALTPGQLPKAMAELKEKSSTSAIDVLCDFSSELTLKEAGEAAAALALVDSVRIRINGVKKGQYFFRAFLPLEKWRDRAERLSQPPEVHFAADGSVRVTEIKEDWSDPDTLDPKLTVVEHPCATLAEAVRLATSLAKRPNTIFIFAPADFKLERLHAFREQIQADILNWYLFTE